MRKPFLTYFLICAVPLLLLAALNYWNTTRSVDNAVNTIVQNDLNSFLVTVDRLLDDQGKEVMRLASPAEAPAPGLVAQPRVDRSVLNSVVI